MTLEDIKRQHREKIEEIETNHRSIKRQLNSALKRALFLIFITWILSIVVIASISSTINSSYFIGGTIILIYIAVFYLINFWHKKKVSKIMGNKT
jgi:F0F1-type ATP synthase assembly protein I